MSEFASRGRGHETSHDPRSPAHADSYRAAERTPAEKADDAVGTFERDVGTLDYALKALAKARDANDSATWHVARDRIAPALAAAEKELQRARSHIGDASPEATQRLAAAERALGEHRAAAANLGNAPLGWTPVSREAAIVAILDAPLEGGAREGWARKMSALKTELAQLSVPESRALATRLRKPQASDPIAKALAPGLRLTEARFNELLSFLDGARRREAVDSARQLVRRDAVHADTSLNWQPDSVAIEQPAPATTASPGTATHSEADTGHADMVHDPALAPNGPLSWDPAAQSIIATSPATSSASPARGSKSPVPTSAATQTEPASARSGQNIQSADVMTAFGVATQKQPENAGVAFGDAEMTVQRTHAFMRTTGETLLPAFRAAVDALDTPAALQLAHACVQGLGAVLVARDHAKARTRDADPSSRARSRPGSSADASPTAPVETWEIDAHKQLEENVTALEQEVRALGMRIALEMSPQLFRGVVIGNGVQTPPGADTSPLDVVVRESSTTVDLVITYSHIRGLLWPVPWMATREKKKEAVSKIEAWKSRPINFHFLKHVLSTEGYWDVLASETGDSGRSLTTTDTKVHEQQAATGAFGDVGEWDASRVSGLLSRGATDWAVTDEDAEKVYGMIASAAPATRGELVLQLANMGKLGRLCDNLPWRWVEQLHDAIHNPSAKAKLRPYFEEKGGGESLSKVYERKIMENIDEGNYVRGFLWTFLDTAHSGLTYGFKDAHDAAYDAAQEGWISDDAYWSQTAKGLGRAAAMMAVTAATGGAAGAWGEGIAAGLGAGKTTAQIIGGAVGGGAAGVSGQFTGDVYDQLLMGKEGFSSAGDYARAGMMGAGSGAATAALTGGIQAAGSKYLQGSVKTMSQVYAERYPGLDNVLTRIRNAGIREGLVVRVTAQELRLLASSGLTGTANLDDSLARIGMVYRNERIDVHSRTLAKVHPQSEIERFYGDIDPATGQVNVRNQNPSSAGYVADADAFASSTRATDQAARDALGIDGPAGFYGKYKVADDPLFEVTFKVGVELDVPLPQTEAPGTPVGGIDKTSHHRPGVGKTKGDVPEGKLPPGTPIEIVDIHPVGTPRASYPATGAKYGPYPPAPPSVRDLAAPLGGATSGPVSLGTADDQEQDVRKQDKSARND